MKSKLNPFRSAVGIFSTAVAFAGSLLVVVPAHAASIVRNNTANTLNAGTAWTGGAAPGVNDIATWNSTSVGGGQTLGGNVSWAGIFVGSNTPTSGPSFTNALNASSVTVTLGASGINLNNGGASNRSVSFESNVGVVLGANQIWQLSAPTSNNTGNITVASVISGSGSLTVNRPITTFNYLSLSGANTFDGGLTIGSNGRVLVGSGSVVTGTAINSSPLGLGTVTINGPTTLATVGTTASDLAFSSLSLAGDMTIGETTTNTGRIRFTGALDLNNGTRVITIVKGTATGTTTNTTFGFAAIDGLNATVANGTLSLQSSATGGNKSWVNFAGANVVSFTNNAGLIIGNNVSTTFNSSFAFGNNNSDKIPNLTVQSGGTLDMSDQGGNSRSVTTASLAGVGLVTNGSTGTGTATLTINGSSGTAVNNSGFTGQINDGATGKVAVMKTGATTQSLSGNNGYSGATDINGGSLVITGAGSINSTSGVTITSGATFRYNSSVAYSGGAITNNGGTIAGTGGIGVSVALDSLTDKLAPGNSPGIQNYTVAQSWNSFTYQWESNNFTGNAAGTDFDQIQVAGTLNLTGAAANSYALDVLSLTASNTSGNIPNFSETNRQWTILTATGGITGFNGTYWNILTSGFTSSPTWTGIFSLTSDTNNIYLNYAVVPEPRAALIGGLGLLALLRRRRAGVL